MPTVPPEGAEGPLVLALDLGSSSLRAIVYDAGGREVEGTEGRTPCRWTVTSDGGVEGDPDAFVDGACGAIDQALAGAGRLAGGIRAVGISTFWHTLMGVGRDGRPSTPLYSWADERSAAAARSLRERFDESAVRRRTGCVFHPSYPAPRLLWLRGRDPEVWRATSTWMSIGEYLTLRCFGRAACSVSMASGTGLLDQRRCVWDAEVLGAIGLEPGHLAPIVDLQEPFAGLAPGYAARWPALRDQPWLPAAGDGALSNVGTGCVAPTRAALVVGTSGALRVLRAAEPHEVPRSLWHYRLTRNHLLTGGAVSNGGNLYHWMQEQFALGTPEEIERGLAARRAEARGLVVLPFFAGERSPEWPLWARGAVVGLTLATEPLDLLRAGLEGIAQRFALIWDQLRAAIPEVREIIASGGGLRRSPAWMQIMADVLGHEVTSSGEAEGSSRGAALMALELLGAVRVEEVPPPLGETFYPDPGRHAGYLAARTTHLRVEAALAPLQELFHPKEAPSRGKPLPAPSDRVE
ncbi:MAG TPA: gluconokinase [bacterium]|nr:gluconokinase [bacterium]